MNTSMRRYSQQHKDIAQKHERSLFLIEVDKRFAPNANERTRFQVIGTMSMEKASKLLALICESDPIPEEPRP